MSICQTEINPRLPSFMDTFIFYVYRFVKITDYVSSLLMLPYMPYLSFKSCANQLPRNRSKFIHHLLSFIMKYIYKCQLYMINLKISHLYLYFGKMLFESGDF